MRNKYWRLRIDAKYKIDRYYAESIKNPLTPSEQIKWRHDMSLGKGKDYVFKYRIQENIDLDVVWTGSEIDIYSDRLIRLIDSVGVRYKTYQIEIITKNYGKISEFNYKVFRLLEIKKALDRKTEIVSYNIGSVELESFEKIKLKEKICNSGLHLFRIEEKPFIVLISDDLKLLFEENAIKGFIYLDL